MYVTNKISYNFPNLHILKINRMMSICNLFMERPS